MAAPAISLRGVGKRYRVGQGRARYETLRDSLLSGVRRFGRRRSADEDSILWALKDVDLDIAEGEIVGLIGRNGAGKTTLLRILSRITQPTEGSGVLHGRVGSLLEVGTGFHPELTGRENIYLNGAILGMRRTEIRRRFDEIVEFAGVERFIDTPVKRYSTGMFVRLAFSVAAHLEPEILLVDEVLAVGDAEFRKRSLGKMQEVGRTGRTVVLVSHSMPAITSLADRAILLDRGRVAVDGPAESVVAAYLTSDHGTPAQRTWAADDAPGDDIARLLSVNAIDETGRTSDVVDIRDRVGVELRFDVLGDARSVVPMIIVHTDEGVNVFQAIDSSPRWQRPAPGSYVATAWIPGNLLNEGTHIVTVALATIAPGKMEKHVQEWDAIAFQTVNRGEGPSAKGPVEQAWPGAIAPLLEWTTRTA